MWLEVSSWGGNMQRDEFGKEKQWPASELVFHNKQFRFYPENNMRGIIRGGQRTGNRMLLLP